MKKVIALFACLCLTVSVCFAEEISAKSAILYEPKTETILFAKDVETKREIASTTKIMTAVVVIENTELDEMVTVPEECTGIEGTSLYLSAGEELLVSDLLYGLLLKSGNDAAQVLAHYVSCGDVEAFVDMMNEKARTLGLENTNFRNPSGLPAEGHFSTALDMAKLAAYALENPIFAEIVKTKEKSFSARTVKNHNKLLWMYDGANGVKTGYTKAAGRCLVSSAERGSMQLVAVTLSAPNDWEDHTKLFDYGFENYEVFSENEFDEIATIPVVGSNGFFADVSVNNNIDILINKNETFEREILIPRYLYAPISKGDEVGEVIYKINGEEVERVKIISNDSVGFFRKENFWRKLFNFFMKV